MYTMYQKTIGLLQSSLSTVTFPWRRLMRIWLLLVEKIVLTKLVKKCLYYATIS